MAPCCQNVVTPRMIKAGQVSIGDKIQLEDEVVAVQSSSTEEESVPVQSSAPQEEVLPVQGHIALENQIPMQTQPQWQNQANMQHQANMQNQSNLQNQTWMQNQSNMRGSTPITIPGIAGIPGGVIDISSNTTRQILPYSQMTPYMGNVSMGGTMENPSVMVPQSPLTPNGYQEEIDSSALQSFNGFLRTQIGRYMRVEQLVSTDRTEERLGFLVGVGSNFIILQDISTGNIMVIDIFSIRLTYVYYSPAILPSF